MDDRQGALELLLERCWESHMGLLSTPCWCWTGRCDRDGYGLVDFEGRTWRVHRLAWLLMSGEALSGDCEIDHLCRQRRCFNPVHLEAVSGAENQRRRCDPVAWAAAVVASGQELAPAGHVEESLF